MPTTSPPNPASPTSGYSVARSLGKCAACGRDIVTGEKMTAALRDTPAALERVDVCPGCWPTFDKSVLLGYWQTSMPLPAARKKVFVDDTVLCEVFERLADVQEPAKLSFRFVLGLILMRKRILNYDSTRIDDGREIWSMHFKGREDSLNLINPRLTEAQVGEVSTQLGEILNGDL